MLGLEALRFICACSVLIFHYRHFYYVADRAIGYVASQQPFYRFLWPLYDYGFYSVQMFWCISGFIFYWKYKNAIITHTLSLRDYFILRLSRLYPLHILTLFCVCLGQSLNYAEHNTYFVYVKNDTYYFILNLALMQNWIHTETNFNGPLWSISIETFVYLIFYLALRISGCFIVNIGLILICFCIATFFQIGHFLLQCIIFFYLGTFSAYVFKWMQGNKYQISVTYISRVLAITIPLITYAFNRDTINDFEVIWLMFYAPLAIYVCADFAPRNKYVTEIILHAGNMTYTSYAIHFPLQLIAHLIILRFHMLVAYQSAAFFLAYISIALILAYVTYYYFELPMQNIIRSKWMSRTEAPRRI